MAEQESKYDDSWDLKWDLLVADAWADDALMQRLTKDPASLLKERGMKVPPGVQVKVFADTDKVTHLVIPPKPTGEAMSEEELSTVAGGHCGGCRGCGCGGCRGCGCGHGGCRRCGGCWHS